MRWNDRVHGGSAEPFWIWVEDPENNFIYHHEYFLLSKKQVRFSESQDVVFTIPIQDPMPPQYYIRAISDRWIGSENYCAISFKVRDHMGWDHSYTHICYVLLN